MLREAQEDRVTTVGLKSEASTDSMLRDIYWAEQHLIMTLPKMEAAATTEILIAAFADRLMVSQKHVTPLQNAFSLPGEQAAAKNAKPWPGLSEKGRR